MRASRGKQYRRSWRNLLINRSYQLRFTLFMVTVTAVLMCGLGWWVMQEARKATKVSINEVLGDKCPDAPSAISVGTSRQQVVIGDITEMTPLPEPGQETAPETASPEAAAPEAAAPEAAAPEAAAPEAAAPEAAAPEAAAPEAAAPEASGPEAAAPRARPEVVIDSANLMLDPTVAAAKQPIPPEYVEQIIGHYQCEMDQAARIGALNRGYDRIFLVLVMVGVFLLLGLSVYTIKMTHRVAGPLHKVTLYFEKMGKERYDTVYDLRRGDQLIEFYDHFKAAHKGLTQMQRDDIARLRAVIEAAEGDESQAARSPEVMRALEELKAALARKEASLDQ